MALELEFFGEDPIPVEVEGIVPSAVRSLSLDAIAQLPIYHGNRQQALASKFRVAGDPSDGRIRWRGDLRSVHWIGAKMDSGEMMLQGDAGRHIGSDMTGGSITVDGSVSDWLGGELQGGFIEVRGDAGHLVGAAYRGSPQGMTGGTILVHGSAGNEIGHSMRRGLIAVGGDCGDLAGFNMLAGTILVFGRAGIRHGAGMRRGTLAFFHESAPPLLPSFRRGCRYRPLYFELLSRQLERWKFPRAELMRTVDTTLYHGDLIAGGRGELFTIQATGE